MKIQMALRIPYWLMPRRIRDALFERSAMTGSARRTHRIGGPAASLETEIRLDRADH